MKKENSGFTLIEIILAIALLGIISVAFLGAMSSNYTLLNRTKALTTDVFESQEDIEKIIENTKMLLSDNDPLTNPSGGISYSIFERISGGAITVKGFLISTTDNFNLNTIVTETRTPEFKVPTVTKVDLNLYEGASILSKNYEYEELPNLSIKAKAEVDKNGVFLLNKHEWYVSRSGFNIPIIDALNIDKDFDYGRLYPLFPNDYIPVPIKSETNTSVESVLDTLKAEYAGRHIIYTVTPFALSGKQGETYFSEPIFLSGLPVVSSTNLILHLDASVISKEDSNSVDSLFVKKWIDQSTNGNHLTQSNIDRRPELDEVQYQSDVYSWGKSTKPVANSISMSKSSSLTGISTDTNNFTFIIVAKSDSITATIGSHIIRGGSSSDSTRWRLEWVEDTLNPGKRNLAFSIGASSIVLPNQLGLDGEWHIYTGTLSSGEATIRMDGAKIGTIPYSGTAKMSSLDLSWNNSTGDSPIEIAEVIIYNNDISKSGSPLGKDLTDVETYLKNKYDPDPLTYQMYILNIVPISPQTVYKNSTFVMPTTITANMSNGTTKNIAVNWSNPIDTSTTGRKTSVGTAVLGNAMTVTLKVNVIEIDSIKPIAEITIDEDYNYPLPTMLPAVIKLGTEAYEENIDVIWTPTTTEGLSAGTHVLTATAIKDNSKSVDMVTNIIYNPITSIEITGSNNLTIPISTDLTSQYNATVYRDIVSIPTQKVTWSIPTSYNNVSIDPITGLLVVTKDALPGTVTIKATSVSTPSISKTYSITLKLVQYTVSFDVQGGTPSPSSLLVNIGSPYNTLPNVTKSGFNFEGWFTASSGGTKVNTSTLVTNNHTLYAQWRDVLPPSVTKLGNGTYDFQISGGSSATLIFSEPISTSSRTAIQTAITNASSRKPLNYSWNADYSELTISRSGNTAVFGSDVTVNVTDMSGNTAYNLLLIDSR